MFVVGWAHAKVVTKPANPANFKGKVVLDNSIPLAYQPPGQPDDVAEAMLFVARERYITGAVLDVDGGARRGDAYLPLAFDAGRGVA